MRKMNNIRRGGALVLVIIAMVILFVTGVGLLAVGYGSRLLAIRDTAVIAARSAADAGASEAIHKLNKLLKDNPSFSDPPTSLNVTNQMIGSASNNQSVTYTVTGTWSNYTITSTGTSNGTTKTVTAYTRAAGLFDPAIYVAEELTMNNNDIVGAAAGTELIVGTLSTDAGAISGGSGTKINGNVFSPPGTNPASVIEADVGVGYQKFAIDEPPPMGSNVMPTFIGIDKILNEEPLSAGVYYYNDLTLEGTVTITGNVTMYVNDDIIMNNGEGLSINAGASLTIYINGDMIGKNNTELGLNNNNVHHPESLKIYGTAQSPDTQTFSLKNNAAICAAIHAPNANITLMNNADVEGSIIAKNLTVKNNMDFVYNASIRNYAKTDPGVYLVIANWSE